MSNEAVEKSVNKFIQEMHALGQKELTCSGKGSAFNSLNYSLVLKLSGSDHTRESEKLCPDCEAPLNENGGCSERCNGGYPSLDNGGYEGDDSSESIPSSFATRDWLIENLNQMLTILPDIGDEPEEHVFNDMRAQLVSIAWRMKNALLDQTKVFPVIAGSSQRQSAELLEFCKGQYYLGLLPIVEVSKEELKKMYGDDEGRQDRELTKELTPKTKLRLAKHAIVNLKKRIADLEAAHLSTLQDLGDCAGDRQKLQVQVTSLEQANAELKLLAMEADCASTELKERIAELESALEALRECSNNKFDRIQELEQANAELKAEVERLRGMENLNSPDPMYKIRESEYDLLVRQRNFWDENSTLLFKENAKLRAALEKIADVTSAMKDGRTYSYRDFELRKMAEDALKKEGE